MNETLTEPSRRLSARAVALMWLWLALAAGLLQPPLLLLRRVWVDIPMKAAWQVFWLTPLGYLIYLAPVALVAAALIALFPKRISPRAALWVLAFPSIAGVTLTFDTNLHWIAVLLVSLGGSIRLTQMAGAGATRFTAVARRSLPWLLGAVVALALGANGLRVFRERRAVAALPEAAAGTPNVLLLILDTVRALSMSAYGHDRPTTPNLEQIIREGVSFDRAIATSPWTLPSHASMFTGEYRYRLSTEWSVPLDNSYPTLAEVLRDRGYNTGGFVANTFYTHWETGLNRGFIHYSDTRANAGTSLMNARLSRFVFGPLVRRLLLTKAGIDDIVPGRRSAAHVNRTFLRWVDRNGDRPFFAFLNYYDAHGPYRPPPELRERFDRVRRRYTLWEKIGLTLGFIEDDRPQEEQERGWTLGRLDRYDALINLLDEQIRDLLDELEQRGKLDNTIIMIIGDHGELIDDHGDLRGHGRRLYSQEVWVPFVLRYPPAVPSGVRVAHPVSLRSVPATVLDILDIDAPLSGASLAGYWRGEIPNVRDTVLSELSSETGKPIGEGALRSVVIDSLHYIRRAADGREQLFNIFLDPAENEDLLRGETEYDLGPFRDVLARHPWPAIDTLPDTSTARAASSTGR